MLSRTKLVGACIGVAVLGGLFLLTNPSLVFSHCQIPCGIFDDNGRLAEMAEHITTIEKSITMIGELSKEQPPNYNQIVRWVSNKDHHADELADLVTYYFMAQRVKPTDKSDEKAYGDYMAKLTLLHGLLVNAMKSKQTTDMANVEKLRGQLAAFKMVYSQSK